MSAKTAQPFAEAARAYHDAGFTVIPVAGKMPLVPWRRWQTRPQTRVEVDEMIERHPDADIAFMLSSRLDIETDGPQAESQLMAMGLPLPPTATFRSPSGVHRLFCAPPEIRGQRILWRGGKHEEVRVRAGPGFYVVAPRSAGRTWEHPLNDMADAPAHLLLQLQHTSRPRDTSRTESSSVSHNSSSVVQPRSSSVVHGSQGRGDEDDEAIAAALLRWTGRDWPGLGRRFRCPVPGHTDQNPSANIWRTAEGRLRFHCFSCGALADVSLPHVFAALIAGRPMQHLGKGEVRVWAERMMHTLGFAPVVVVPPPLPADAPQEAFAVWSGAHFLAALMRNSPVILTIKFVEDWCRLSTRKARAGKRWLIERGFLTETGVRTVGRRGYMFYSLRSVAEEPMGHEQYAAVVARAVELFDGEIVEVRRIEREAVA